MKREIKFRFWSKATKSMIDWNLAKKECDRLSLLSHDKFIPMQFTGLKDENGRERYESDLYEIRVNGIETHVEDIVCEVKWSDISAGFGFYRISGDSEQPEWIGMTDKNILSLKYIGKIYENSEL